MFPFLTQLRQWNRLALQLWHSGHRMWAPIPVVAFLSLAFASFNSSFVAAVGLRFVVYPATSDSSSSPFVEALEMRKLSGALQLSSELELFAITAKALQLFVMLYLLILYH